MADDPNPPDPAATTDPPKDPPQDPPDDGLSDAGRRAIREERSARREAERRAREVEARLKELEDQGKSEQQKLAEERDALRTRVPDLESQNLRLKVALKKGLVGDRAFIADRLRGDTEEALEKDADALLAQLKPAAVTDFDAGVRTPTDTPTDMNALIRGAAGRT